MSHPLIETKLFLPSPRPGLVPRPRLRERLDRGLDEADAGLRSGRLREDDAAGRLVGVGDDAIGGRAAQGGVARPGRRATTYWLSRRT